MLNLYNELFHIPKHEKIREKVMLARITVTITIVILCLAAMSFTAYAYFSHSVTSGSSAMKSANFEIKLEITDENGVAVDNSQITTITADYRSFKIEGLTVGKSYTVTIKPTEQSTAMTGFAILTADNCAKTYHTQQLAKDVTAKGGQTPSLSFKLTITDTTNVYLKAHWGTSSYYDAYKDNGNNGELYITQGEEIELSIQNNTPAP
ncbi:MAG: hypothetical protein IKM06_05195, partial [Clostridia bacterium]|nr:hypothetical protein [Clostridia bacterium]